MADDSFRASPRSLKPVYTGGPVLLSRDGRWLTTTLNEEVLITDLSTGLELARIKGVSPLPERSSVCVRSCSSHVGRLSYHLFDSSVPHLPTHAHHLPPLPHRPLLPHHLRNSLLHTSITQSLHSAYFSLLNITRRHPLRHRFFRRCCDSLGPRRRIRDPLVQRSRGTRLSSRVEV